MERPGRRCALGCGSWPDKAIYATCPECGGKTQRFTNLEPMDDADAESILLHQQFERYYERWCIQKNQPVEGPLACD